MLDTVIAPNNTLEVPYAVPLPGILTYHVVSNEVVTSYLVDAGGRNAFFGGQPFQNWGTVEGRQMHSYQAQIPYAGQWYLLIHTTFPNTLAHVQVDIVYQPIAHVVG
jgi:hypothetical protein